MPSAAQIDEMLAALRVKWLRNPDFRVGKLAVNTVNPNPLPRDLLPGRRRAAGQAREAFPAD